MSEPVTRTQDQLDGGEVWFITGCSTGFGRQIAKEVLGRGGRAIATAADPQKLDDIVEVLLPRVTVGRLPRKTREEARRCSVLVS